METEPEAEVDVPGDVGPSRDEEGSGGSDSLDLGENKGQVGGHEGVEEGVLRSDSAELLLFRDDLDPEELVDTLPLPEVEKEGEGEEVEGEEAEEDATLHEGVRAIPSGQTMPGGFEPFRGRSLW